MCVLSSSGTYSAKYRETAAEIIRPFQPPMLPKPLAIILWAHVAVSISTGLSFLHEVPSILYKPKQIP